MKIKRNICVDSQKMIDIEFELTPYELYQAYQEEQHICDIEDVQCVFDNMDDSECVECYGVTKAEIKDLYCEIANEMRRNIDKYDMHWESARDEAILTIVARERNN